MAYFSLSHLCHNLHNQSKRYARMTKKLILRFVFLSWHLIEMDIKFELNRKCFSSFLDLSKLLTQGLEFFMNFDLLRGINI